ncbi:hypothetical protein [Cereibacter azotoformans]|uniref:Uncharacterized protein n=1 Tax=Cereibacter azotoformans TaxID=43057 RepID=A0A2T5JN70_9RHOB|nr:hypothetical protein [Cereibacter azotoformans]MBO4169556.1 hypothetical protein [Cereibacter azotoformans]PTR08715.1 hypothetical protein C8J28_1342 [Cereibacter azotoformans]
MTDSILKVITEYGPVHFPPGSARQIRVELSQVYQGELRRTVNGRLVDLTRPSLRKWRLTLSADGVTLPDLSGAWQGVPVTVHPPVTWYAAVPAGVTSWALERPAVAGAWRAVDAATGAALSGVTLSGDGLTVTLPAGHPAARIEYQPALDCLITDISTSGDEWDAVAGWSATFEEV